MDTRAVLALAGLSGASSALADERRPIERATNGRWPPRIDPAHRTSASLGFRMSHIHPANRTDRDVHRPRRAHSVVAADALADRFAKCIDRE
jgi:hypothetical protein